MSVRTSLLAAEFSEHGHRLLNSNPSISAALWKQIPGDEIVAHASARPKVALARAIHSIIFFFLKMHNHKVPSLAAGRWRCRPRKNYAAILAVPWSAEHGCVQGCTGVPGQGCRQPSRVPVLAESPMETRTGANGRNRIPFGKPPPAGLAAATLKLPIPGWPRVLQSDPEARNADACSACVSDGPPLSTPQDGVTRDFAHAHPGTEDRVAGTEANRSCIVPGMGRTGPRMRFRVNRLTGLLAAVSFAIALSGCGGGGGGGGGSSASPGPVGSLPQQRQQTCIETAVHGCISRSEFETRRNNVAAVLLADEEFSGSTTDTNLIGQPALEQVNAHKAHAALAVKYGVDTKPGDGVTIAVMDSGVDLTHAELDNASVTETILQNLPNEERTDYDSDSYSHGTAVTSIMAAEKNDAGFLGLAWGANFKVFTVPIGDHSSLTQTHRNNFDWEAAHKSVLASGVDIVNGSYGIPGTFVENYTAETLRNSARLGPSFTVIAQAGAANPTIYVWIAGNDHEDPCDPLSDQNCVWNSSSSSYEYNATSPNLEGGAVALLTELQGHNVVVVAVGPDGEIADFSNRCGIAGPWCIAAPGAGIRGAEFGSVVPPPGTFRVRLGLRGTSFAAPMVSGGLALMKHFFRNQLSNRELVTRLFATANRNGEYAPDRPDGTSSIYGQGLMDLGAAVSPVGDPRLMTQNQVSGKGHDIQNTRFTAGQAFGDGLSRSLADRQVAAFDAMAAPFWYDVPDLVGAWRPPSALARLRGLMTPRKPGASEPGSGTRVSHSPYARVARRDTWHLGLFDAPSSTESSLLNQADLAASLTFRTPGGLEATGFSTPHHPRSRTRELGALLALRPPDAPVGLRVGWLRETGSVLGSTADGAFGQIAANSVTAGFEAAADLGAWSVSLDTEVGLVEPHAVGGLIENLSPLTTSAMSLRASRRLATRNELTISLSQPPRIERGSAELTLPVGRTTDGDILHESLSADLVPSARQIDVSASWRRTGVFGGALHLEAAASRNPGHAPVEPAFSLLAGWRVDF